MKQFFTLLGFFAIAAVKTVQSLPVGTKGQVQHPNLDFNSEKMQEYINKHATEKEEVDIHQKFDKELAKQAEKEVSEAESLPEKLRTAMNDMASTQYQEVLAQLSNTQTELRKNYDKNARSAFSAAKRLINESHKNYGKKFDIPDADRVKVDAWRTNESTEEAAADSRTDYNDRIRADAMNRAKTSKKWETRLKAMN